MFRPSGPSRSSPLPSPPLPSPPLPSLHPSSPPPPPHTHRRPCPATLQGHRRRAEQDQDVCSEEGERCFPADGGGCSAWAP